MKRLLLAPLAVVLALAIAPFAFAGNPHTTTTTTTTSISVTGHLNTVVDSNVNTTGWCNNGNPAVNCNIYTSKQYVYLNEAAATISPDGVYFYLIGEPGVKEDPSQESLGDTTNKNLSDDYDCYLNREVVISGGKITKVLSSTDPNCFANHTPTPHLFDSPFVQAFPFADTGNNGGEYQAVLCYVGQLDPSHPTTPVVRPSGTFKANDLCAKSDNFKVVASTPTPPPPDTTPPTCKLTATVAGPPKQIQVTVQDTGSGLASVVPTATNATVVVGSFSSGETNPVLVTATKTNQALGATLKLTVTDVKGNVTVCDPVIPAQRVLKLVGTRAHVLAGLPSGLTTLVVRNGSHTGSLIVRVNGHAIRIGHVGSHQLRRVNIARWMISGRHNRITVQQTGQARRATVVIA